MTKQVNGKTKQAVLEERLNNLEGQNKIDHKQIMDNVDRVHKRLDDHFVMKSEFKPVRNIIYGAVSLILTAVLVAVIGLVTIAR